MSKGKHLNLIKGTRFINKDGEECVVKNRSTISGFGGNVHYTLDIMTVKAPFKIWKDVPLQRVVKNLTLKTWLGQ